MKKLLSALLVLAILLAVLPVGMVSAETLVDGDYEYTVTEGKATITQYTGIGGDVVIPDTLGGYPVVEIGMYFAYDEDNYLGAFYGRRNVTSVTIPEGVTTIGSDAFSGCNALTSVTLPKSVTTIDDRAFYGCNALKDVYYGLTQRAAETISYGSYYSYLRNATWHYTYPSDDPSDPIYFKYTVNDGKATITQYTGIGGDVVIPSTLGGYPVVALKSQYNLGDGPKDAFMYCTGLTSVTIPEGVTTIGSFIFYGCSNLKTVTIPASVTTIGSETFYDCTSLTSVTIPASVTTIGYDAFNRCSNLEAVYISDMAAWCGINFDYDSILNGRKLYLNGELVTDLVIPDGVKKISDSAFDGYEHLTSVTLPDSVTTIGSSAFSYCTALVSVTIPSDVISIGDWAFRNCTGLTDVWYSGAKIDRALMAIDSGNTPLTSANWHYEVIVENGHYYSGSCDADCDKCGEVRQVPHVYSDCCDRECNVCFAIRKAPHNYAYVCDDECDTCGFLRKVTHTYDNNYDVDCNVCGDVRTVQYEIYAFAGNSTSPEVSGLAFRFNVAVDGLTATARNETIYDGATVVSNSDVGPLKLVKMGVVMSNRDDVLRLENVNDNTCIDIAATYLTSYTKDSAVYVVRVIHIPQEFYDRVITVRPYCIYEDDAGNLLIEYGDVQRATYNSAAQ